ncbi:MAG: glutamyl-tRNA synthetase [Myxococcota bacterium]|jgi:glutamyl-tRNA synthetase
MTVRTRIAPSPTGDPHVGTAYVALFNKIWAEKHGGQFILRIEDTDQVRSTPESEEAILRSLRWLGLEWDEGPDIGGPCGPYRQSERTEIYREHAALLLENGRAYRCFCTPERLVEMRKAQEAAKAAYQYDGLCKGLDQTEVDSRVAAGEPHTVRLDFPDEGQTVVADGLRGNITIENTQIDDQVLMKSDGFPTYHLANVVDDHLMGITDVIRAEEWISSTPKHLELYKAFGWEAPRLWHLPLLRNTDKSKISKRKNPVSLDYYERIGILPETLVNFLGMLGWSMPDETEKFTPQQMLEAFTFDRVSVSGPVFDIAKLEWLNALYIRALAPEDLASRVANAYLKAERLVEIASLLHERVTRLDQLIPMASYMLGGGDLEYDHDLLIPKKKFSGGPSDVRKALLKAAEVLDTVRPWEAENIEAAMRALAKELEWKAGQLFTPIRVAVAGRLAAPPLFETMVAVGAPLSRARIRQAAAHLKGK